MQGAELGFTPQDVIQVGRHKLKDEKDIIKVLRTTGHENTLHFNNILMSTKETEKL